MNWRPEGWKNPYEPELQTDGLWSNAGYTEEYDAFEAGADAMLEALKEHGEYVDGTKVGLNYGYVPAKIKINSKVKGWLMFVPDKEVSNAKIKIQA